MPTEVYCAYVPFYGALQYCMTMAEWSSLWQAVGSAGTLLGVLYGVWKGASELKRIREQKEDEAALERTEFFLRQHRRLFDDPDLCDVLNHLDGDDWQLASFPMWEKNRKFLAFIEEIALLVNSKKLDRQVAYYMFGHYAICARDGPNFNVGIDTSEMHWKLFHEFVAGARQYRVDNPEGPRKSLTM